MEMMTILMRTVFTYFFILILLRVMGKRELGKMSVFDVVISIMLAEMAVLAIEDADREAMKFYIPMVLIAVLEIAMSFLSLKSKRFRDLVDGTPDIIIENGRIREEAMRRNRLNLDDLMVHLRLKNISNISDVEFAVLEPTGQVSVFPRKELRSVSRKDLGISTPPPVEAFSYTGPPIPLIMDGKIRNDALRKLGLDELWLKREIRKYGIKDIRDVSFCSIDDRGVMYLDKKDKPRH